MRNGAAPAFTAGVVQLANVNGTIWVNNSTEQWYYWTGSAWTSGAAPTLPGRGGTVSDGGVTWQCLSAIDFTTLQAWANAIPAGMTQPYLGWLWNDGPITAAGGILLTIPANTGSSSTNTITLQAAPGDSLRSLTGGPLGPSLTNGSCLNASYGWQYTEFIDIEASYVTFDGLQIYDSTTGTSHYRLLSINGSNFTLSNSIVFGQSQDSGYNMINLLTNATFVNSIIVDTMAAGDNYNTIGSGNGAGNLTLASSIIYCPNNNTSGTATLVGGSVVNSAILGFAAPISGADNSIPVSYSVFDATIPTSAMQVGAGVSFGNTAVALLNAPGTDFRPRAGSALLNAGSSSASPASDIYYSHRPLGAAWDIGPYESIPPSEVNVPNVSAVGHVTLSAPVHGFVQVQNSTAHGVMLNPVGASGAITAIRFTAAGQSSGVAFRGSATLIAVSARGVVSVPVVGLVGKTLLLSVSAAGRMNLTAPTPIVSYVQFGLTAWTANTLYAIGARVLSGGNAYRCITAGRSQNLVGAGPTGTGAAITDGTTTWKYLSRVDYTDLQTWANALPATLTQPQLAYVDGIYTAANPATPYLQLQGHVTTPVNTISIRVLPGEGLRDTPGPLAFTSGRTAIVTGTPGYPWNWIDISDSNVNISGLQFQQPTADGCTLFATEAGAKNVILEGCLFDGFGQGGGAALLALGGGATLRNCVVIDRETVAGGTALDCYDTTVVACSTIVNVVAPTGAAGIIGTGSAPGMVTVRDSILAGYSDGMVANNVSGGIEIDHSAITSTTFGTNVADGGGNIVGATPGFVNGTTDFRLAAGSVCRGAGIADPADIPTGIDFFRTLRPVGSWDIGAYQHVNGSVARLMAFSGSGIIYTGQSVTGRATSLTFGATGRLNAPQPASGTAGVLNYTALGQLTASTSYVGTGLALRFSVVSYASIPLGASGVATWARWSTAGNTGLQASAFGADTVLTLSARGIMNIPVVAYGSGSVWSAFSGAGVARQDDAAHGGLTLGFTARGAGGAGQSAHGAASALSFTATGSVIFPNAFTGSGTLAFSAIGNALEFDQAAGKGNIFALIPDGNMALAAPVSGRATILRLTGIGNVINPYPFVGATTAITLRAAGAAALSDVTAGVPTALSVSASGYATLSEPAIGRAMCLGFSGTGTASVGATVTGSATFHLSGFGAAGMEMRAYGTDLLFSETAYGTAFMQRVAHGAPVALAFSGTGAVGQAEAAHGVGTFGFSLRAEMTNGGASGQVTWGTWTAHGAVTYVDALFGSGALTFGAMGAVAQFVPTTGTGAFGFSASGAAFQIPAGGDVDEIIYFPRDDKLIYFRR